MKRPSSTLFMACFLVAASVLASETTTIDDWLDMAFYPGCEPKDSRGIAATLQAQFGMTPAAIRERCLSVALDETADTPKRAGAVRFLCEVFPAPERGDLTPFFVHEKVQLRNVAVLSCFESASNVVEKLHFAEDLFGRAATNALFLPAATVVSRRFGQMLRYGSPSEQDRNTILSTFAAMMQTSARDELLRLSEDASADMDDFMSADDLIRGCLADVHRSSASVTALIANLERSFGMDKESVLERFIQIASSPQEPLETRTAAIFSFCSGAGEPGLGRLRVFFADENDGVRQTALSATMGTLSTVSSQLDFLKERLDAWKDNERFQNDAPVLVGRFHQILQYKSGSEEERQNVRSFFRARAKNPSFPSCAFVCESILARFDPDWPTSSDRHELLLRWKDDSTLSAFARQTMNDAWASIETGDGEVSSRSPSTMVPGQSTSGETSIREVSGSKETDSTAEGAEPIVTSEDNRPTGLPRSRLARIVGSVVLLAIAFSLAFRRRHRRSNPNEDRQPAE